MLFSHLRDPQSMVAATSIPSKCCEEKVLLINNNNNNFLEELTPHPYVRPLLFETEVCEWKQEKRE
jgi:hypothetical protein